MLCWRCWFFSKASREPSPDPSTEEARPEKEQSTEKNKQEKNAEPKQVRDQHQHLTSFTHILLFPNKQNHCTITVVTKEPFILFKSRFSIKYASF